MWEAFIFKCLLIVVNILFGIIGFAFLAIGIAAMVARDVIMGQVDRVLDSLPALSAVQGNNMTGIDSGSQLDFEVEAYLDPAGVAFIVIGVFLILMSMAGLFGACCDAKVFLIVYAVIVGLFSLLMIAISIAYWAFWNDIENKVTDYLINTITENYQGTSGTDATSLLWNVLHLQLECCGVLGYKDFLNATKWNRTMTYEVVPGEPTSFTQKTPFTCCKMVGSFPTVTPVVHNCSIDPTDTISNWDKGCWSTLRESYFDPYRYLVGALLITLTVFVVAITVAAVCLYEQTSTKPV